MTTLAKIKVFLFMPLVFSKNLRLDSTCSGDSPLKPLGLMEIFTTHQQSN
jgi:hypothetical protein